MWSMASADRTTHPTRLKRIATHTAGQASSATQTCYLALGTALPLVPAYLPATTDGSISSVIWCSLPWQPPPVLPNTEVVLMKITSVPQIYRNANRWREILSTLSKYGLAGWISRFDLSFAKGLLKNRNGEVLAKHSRETRIRLALEELGPTFIKLGQILSTRPDLAGIALADELKKLQTDVPADPPDVVRTTIETEMGQPIEDLFAEFNEKPLASASIGQVHLARLHNGDEVVVKVQHHDIEQQIRVDLDILTGLAQLAERIPEMAVYRPKTTVAEFQRALRRELDFGREERNMQQFARDFADDETVQIPTSYTEFSTPRVLTMQRLDGIKLTETTRLAASEIDLDEIARRGARLYLEMIFENGFYHADPHPGNMVLLEGGVIGLLDFGMVGRIDESMRDDLEELLMAIVGEDSERLTSVITRIGAVPSEMDETALSGELADYVSHFGNLPLESFDLSGALREMIEIVRRYRIMLPAPLAMLLKVLIMLEGTAQLLNPRFNLTEVMEPYQKKMVRRRLSPLRQVKRMQRVFYEVEQLAELLPRRIREILQQIQTGRFDVHLDHRGLEPSVNRLVLGMLASALFVGSSLMISRGVGVIELFSYRFPIPGMIGMLASLALGVRLWRAISKSGHLDRRR